MSYLKTKTLILATPVVLLGLFFISSCATSQKAGVASTATHSMAPGAVALPQLEPGPNDPRIAYVTARLLDQFHYTQRPMDKLISERFFDGYVDSLDSRHEYFLQSDLAEFSKYRTNLDKLTVGQGPTSDLTPAFAVYERFLERLQQHNDYWAELLGKGHFKFNTDERIAIDRRHAPFPKDLAEAHQLWDQELRYQYLEGKLSNELLADGTVTNLTKTNIYEITNGISLHAQWNLHIFTNWDSTDVLQAYLNGLTHAYDPHSDYFNPEHAQDFAINMNLSLFGIGAQLTEDDGYCTISKLIVGGPADKSKKLNEKDRVIAVAQDTNPPVNVVNMELGKVVQLIRGPKATTVRLTISPAEDRAAREVVSLVRDEIKLDDQAAKARLIEMPDAKGGTHRLGIIDLPSFYAPVGLSSDTGQATPQYTSVDVAKLIAKLKEQNVEGIILDIRSNPGGSLEEAVKFTGLFIKGGPVVLARSPDGPINIDSSTDTNMVYGGPLAVMINRYSASASEIAAAALQDYDRALIVGDTSSFGKGTVQSLNNLRPFVWAATPTATNDPGVVKITIRKFYRINGTTTQFKGVVPDIILPDPLDHEMGIESEATLDNPLPWDTIAPAENYTKFNMVQQYVPALTKDSAARIATNQDFVYIQQDIAELEKQKADRSITLNEHEAIKERQTNLAKQKARDAERDARKPANLTVYDISLADADKPGLPAPDYYPGMLETNDTDTSTLTLKQANSDYTSDDKALARSVGLDLATGKITNPMLDTNVVIGITNSTATITKFEVKLKQPDVDPLLRETTDIMLDYISMMSQSAPLTKN
jgi:carboxyl-terminal processing protease